MATRHERVVLDLEDRLSAGMVRAASATALLDKQLNSLSGRSTQSHRTLSTAEKDVSSLGRSSESGGRQIDKLSGRLEILAEVAGAVGPALVPIGAAAIPAVAGLANQLGVAALAGGTAVLAFQGVGTALKALDQYQLEPTAAHFQAMQIAMSAVGPAGRDFVRQLEEMKPLFEGIQNTARQGLFPGVTDALQGIATRAPEVNHLIETISTTLGGLMSEAGQGISGGALDSFIQSLDTEARPALTQLGHSIADVTLGLAGLMQAFMPLSLSFGAGMERAAAGFRKWADGLSQTQGFHDFVAYLQSTGPQVLAFLGALGNDFVQIVEAAAPLGGPVLESLTAIARAIGAIADSPLGTPIFTAISALSAYNLALKATTSLQRSAFAPAALSGKVNATRGSLRGLTSDLGVMMTGLRGSAEEVSALGAATERTKGRFSGFAAGAGQIAAVGLLASGAADKFNLTNTATLALAGSMVGPLGAGIGAVAGAFLDANAAASTFNDNLSKINTETNFDAAKQRVADLQKQIADLEHHNNLADFLGDFSTGIGLLAHGHLTDSGLYDDLDRAKKKVAELNGEVVAGSPAMQSYQNAIRNSGVAAGHTAAEINGMVSAMQANRTAALGAFDAETQYRQALKAAQAQAAKNNAGLRGSSDAVLQNRGALSQLAAAWNNQSAAVRNNVSRFHEARSAFIATAHAMGVPIPVARHLADTLLSIPKSVVVRAAIVGGTEAMREIQAIKAQLASVPRSIRTEYYVDQINSVSKRLQGGGAPLPGRYATGGYTGDRPADEPVGVVHGREFVFDAAATAKAGVDNLYALQRQLRGYADGGYVGPNPWTSTAWNASAPPPAARNAFSTSINVDGVGVFSVTKADRANAQFIANLVHQTHREKASDRLAELQAMQQIRDFQKQLAAHNKKKKDGTGGGLSLTGLDRKETQAELAQAIQGLKDLRSHADGAKQAVQQVKDALNSKISGLKSAEGGLNFNSALGIQPTNPIASQVHDALAQFKQQILDAGGTWTKHLANLSTATIKQAMAIDADNRALDKANTAHDALTQGLSDLTSQMDSLSSTMSQFGSSVGGNFLSNPFGLGGQSSTFTPTVDTSPALSAATDQLNAAKAHLAALSTGDGDINTRLANAYAAQGVASDVQKLQAQVDQLSQPVTTTTDALSSFRDMLKSDTQKALDFNTALSTLASEGLSTDVFSALAQSGDVNFASELAAAGQSAVSDINTLWNDRATAASQVAALATQQVYGQQQAILQGQITQQNALITSNTATLNALNAQVATLGQRVQNGAAAGVAGIQAQIDALSSAVASIPRQIDHATR